MVSLIQSSVTLNRRLIGKKLKRNILSLLKVGKVLHIYCRLGYVGNCKTGRCAWCHFFCCSTLGVKALKENSTKTESYLCGWVNMRNWKLCWLCWCLGFLNDCDIWVLRRVSHHCIRLSTVVIPVSSLHTTLLRLESLSLFVRKGWPRLSRWML